MPVPGRICGSSCRRGQCWSCHFRGGGVAVHGDPGTAEEACGGDTDAVAGLQADMSRPAACGALVAASPATPAPTTTSWLSRWGMSGFPSLRADLKYAGSRLDGDSGDRVSDRSCPSARRQGDQHHRDSAEQQRMTHLRVHIIASGGSGPGGAWNSATSAPSTCSSRTPSRIATAPRHFTISADPPCRPGTRTNLGRLTDPCP